jgi:murein L,D-transpeptidase YafK
MSTEKNPLLRANGPCGVSSKRSTMIKTVFAAALILAIALSAPAATAAPNQADRSSAAIDPTTVAPATPQAPETGPCPKDGNLILVETSAHRLWLCSSGKVVEAFRVALGSGGIDKRRQGDAKVPLGDYALDVPRASSSFHLFILVGYPTAAQQKAGFTGGAIGVHGPARGYETLGSSANTAVDWTLGCIAVGSDDEIERIADWQRRNKVHRIRIK